jgi:hypothetical protein
MTATYDLLLDPSTEEAIAATVDGVSAKGTLVTMSEGRGHRSCGRLVHRIEKVRTALCAL